MRHAPFQPRQLARRPEREGLAPEILAYVTVLQTASVGGRCDAIFAVLGHRDHGLAAAISQSSEPIQDTLKRHWHAWRTSGRTRAEGVCAYTPWITYKTGLAQLFIHI